MQRLRAASAVEACRRLELARRRRAKGVSVAIDEPRREASRRFADVLPTASGATLMRRGDAEDQSGDKAPLSGVGWELPAVTPAHDLLLHL